MWNFIFKYGLEFKQIKSKKLIIIKLENNKEDELLLSVPRQCIRSIKISCMIKWKQDLSPLTL